MMTPLFALGLLQTLFGVAMFVSALFIILLVLVQRGRGGGLAGALGGMGGQSAFGAKAGDQFTWITWITGSIWIVLCIGAIAVLNHPSSKFGASSPSATINDATGASGGDAGSEESITPTGDAGAEGGAAAPSTGGVGAAPAAGSSSQPAEGGDNP